MRREKAEEGDQRGRGQHKGGKPEFLQPEHREGPTENSIDGPPGKRNGFREKNINQDSGRGWSVQEADPRNKHGAKAHPLEDPDHVGPVNPVKGLLLIKGENRQLGVSERSISDRVLKKADIFPYETSRNRARLVRGDNVMYNLAKSECDCPRGNLTVDV